MPDKLVEDRSKDPDSPSFADVARTIVNGEPPKWLAVGLEYFSEGIRTAAEWKPGEREQYENRLREMANATDNLLKYLPAFFELPFGIQPPKDVTTTLAALPGVRQELRGLLWRQQGGRKPSIAREICAAVIVEAWRLIHDDDELKSDTDDPTPTSDPTPPPPVIHLALGQAMTNQGRTLAAPGPGWRPSVGPRSERVQQACNQYWLACGCKEIGETGDIENWRRPLERALRSDRWWIEAALVLFVAQNPP
jgi:hypothetical protein